MDTKEYAGFTLVSFVYFVVTQRDEIHARL